MDTNPEHIRWALDLWENFPIDRVPRPVVFCAPPANWRERVASELRASGAWDAPAVPESELTLEQLDAAYLHCRERATGRARPFGRIVRAQVLFGTDRGDLHVPALVMQAEHEYSPFITVDRDFERTMSWRPPGLTNPIGGTIARLAADGQTLTVYFRVLRGSAPSDCSEAVATETKTAVIVGAVEDWQLPPDHAYVGFLGQCKTVVHLAAPLGNRVLIRLGQGVGTYSYGTPIPVYPEHAVVSIKAPRPAPPSPLPASDVATAAHIDPLDPQSPYRITQPPDGPQY